MDDCPCGSGLEYTDCCGRFLDEGIVPDTAEALMRSRYTAYTRKNRDYLLKTWHPTTRPHPASLTLEDDIFWTGLAVLSCVKGGSSDDNGTVEFVANYMHSDKPCSLTEKSRFVRQDKKWFYFDGEAPTGKASEKSKLGRNAPCPCGSGKKYKKCCLSKT